MRLWIQALCLLFAGTAFGHAPQPGRIFEAGTANRLTNTLSPLGRSTKLAFNDRGLLQSLTQPSQRVATFGYDARGRKTSRADQVGTTTYQYDANNNLTNVFENGKTNSWTFDAYDRVSSYRDSAGNLLQYRYDANGNLTNLVYPGNRNVYYAFDSLNRLTNVTDWANRQTTLSYDLAGRLTSISRPNGTVRTIGYDAAGQTTNIVEKTTTGFPIAFFQFTWDNAGRMQWEFGAPLPHNNALPARTLTVDDDNRLATCNGQSVVHDLDGNLTSGPGTNGALLTYTYDARNRPAAIGSLQYGYDPAGNRTSLTNGGAVTRFVINPNAKLPQVLMRLQGGVTNYYIYGPGLLYEISETATSTNTLTYHYDYRGSTIALSGSDGSVRERFEYSAYGLLNFRSGSTDTPFLYNGRFGVQSDANGLLYMRARYYNPYICRFIHADPSGFAGGLNLYAYADGNPVSYVDPFGLDAVGADSGHSLLDKTVNVIDRIDGWVADKGLNLLGSILSAKSGGGREGPSLQMLLSLGVLIASRGESALATAESMESVAAETTLSSDIAATFSGGKYTSTVLQQDMITYRYSGGVSDPVGRFLTTGDTVSQISSPVSASIALNLPEGATAAKLNTFTIPAGTRIFTGGVAGGADTATQIFIQDSRVLIPH